MERLKHLKAGSETIARLSSFCVGGTQLLICVGVIASVTGVAAATALLMHRRKWRSRSTRCGLCGCGATDRQHVQRALEHGVPSIRIFFGGPGWTRGKVVYTRKVG